MSVTLPQRPWLRDDVPLVWRSSTCVEIGFPPHPTRLDGMDEAHVSWLRGLRGEQTLETALAEGRSRGLGVAGMRRLLAAAVCSGLVDDAARMPQTLREAPPPVRDLLAGDVAAARHVHGSTARAREVIDRRRSAEVAVHGESPLADALALTLTCAGVGHVVRSAPGHSSSRKHRRMSAGHACHVLCDSAHPDGAADPDAMALDIPHLALTVAGAQAVIGPLVIPGRTSCLRCRDLHLADADSSWPRAAVQWSARRPGPLAAGLAHAAGALGALQVLALIDAGPREVRASAVDGVLVLTLPDAHIVRQARPPHPLCGCRWPANGAGHGPSAA